MVKQHTARLLIATGACLFATFSTAAPAQADQAITLFKTWSGAVDFFATGAPMAADGPDSDTTQVDLVAQPASVVVTAADVPPGAMLKEAFLYWGGSIGNSNCVGTTIDDTVDVTLPSGTPTAIVADVCYCSDAGALSYDQQLCRKDLTALLGEAPSLTGTYTVDSFSALIANGSTNNASFSIVFVFSAPSLPPRRIALYDGNQTMSSSVNPTQLISLAGLDVDSPAEGDLTWYVLEGDVGGTGTEQVTVTGVPGAASLVCSDGINPAGNPMNHTINTTVPVQTDTIGVDIDKIDISAALTPGDTAVDMLYQAGTDKWWIAYNIVGVNVYEAVFGIASSKSGVLQVDADNNLEPSPGDTIRYTIHLDNTGTAPGVVDVSDVIPPEAVSWVLIDDAGGTDASVPTVLVVNGIPVAVNATADVVFDVVLDDVPDHTLMSNAADFDGTPGGDSGTVYAPDIDIRRDGDSDGHFDDDDICPNDFDPLQLDSDGDWAGDACDVCPFDAQNDVDNDTVCGDVDNCPSVGTTNQADGDSDGIGDVCDACPNDNQNDADNDTVCGDVENCPSDANTNQADGDSDGFGDVCDPCPNDAQNDGDSDTVCGDVDNCPSVANTNQADGDSDGIGDVCDACPNDNQNDADGDTVCGDVDNCPSVANTNQADGDSDGLGDVCDACPNDAQNDSDGDTVCGDVDNCPSLANTNQADGDSDGLGDVCDACPNDAQNDADSDGLCADVDNCPSVANANQADGDNDGVGDACDPCPNDTLNDDDNDGICGDQDNCPNAANSGQEDADLDGTGDVCDPCPDDPDDDVDSDGVCGDVDNCPTDANSGQEDADSDGTGDACDPCPDDANDDVDEDGVCGDVDNCPDDANSGQEDGDGDGAGDLCDPCPNDDEDDLDGDGFCADEDNCPSVANPGQDDADGDGVGDVCDCADGDLDGVCDGVDNCPETANADQADEDSDGVGDACDAVAPAPAGDGVDESGGCGCRVAGAQTRTGPSGGVLLGLLGLLLPWWRRRRSNLR